VRGTHAIAAKSQPHRTHIRLVITRRGVGEILLSRRLSRRSLPWLEVLRGFRLAEQLVSGVLEKYGLKTYCLLVQNVEAAREPRTPHRYAVMEALPQSAEAPPGTTWVPFAAAASEATVGLADRAVMAGSIDRLAKPEQGPFAKPGWLEELFAWVRDQIAPLGLRPTGDFHQLNASASFSLMRIETTGGPMWFKATGEPNTHELSLSLALAELFPRHVPRIIAVHSVRPQTVPRGSAPPRPWQSFRFAPLEKRPGFSPPAPKTFGWEGLPNESMRSSPG
jgi:hypothetical protein